MQAFASLAPFYNHTSVHPTSDQPTHQITHLQKPFQSSAAQTHTWRAHSIRPVILASVAANLVGTIPGTLAQTMPMSTPQSTVQAYSAGLNEDHIWRARSIAIGVSTVLAIALLLAFTIAMVRYLREQYREYKINQYYERASKNPRTLTTVQAISLNTDSPGTLSQSNSTNALLGASAIDQMPAFIFAEPTPVMQEFTQIAKTEHHLDGYKPDSFLP